MGKLKGAAESPGPVVPLEVPPVALGSDTSFMLMETEAEGAAEPPGPVGPPEVPPEALGSDTSFIITESPPVGTWLTVASQPLTVAESVATEPSLEEGPARP